MRSAQSLRLVTVGLMLSSVFPLLAVEAARAEVTFRAALTPQSSNGGNAACEQLSFLAGHLDDDQELA